jgi:hypothetical protein
MSNCTPRLYEVKWLFFPLRKKQQTQAFKQLFSVGKKSIGNLTFYEHFFFEHLLFWVSLRMMFAFVFVPIFVTNKPVHSYKGGIFKQ